MKAIIGLGNPGNNYVLTRHNIGFMVIERLAQRFDLSFKKDAMVSGVVAQHKGDNPMMLVMPTTFMNESGLSIKQVVGTRNIPLDNLLVITDDFNLPFGQLRLRSKGRDGGHNGLKSIIQHIGADIFPRLRMGIGRPQGDVTRYVLGRFSKEEQSSLVDFVDRASDCSELWLTQGVDKAMEFYNSKEG